MRRRVQAHREPSTSKRWILGALALLACALAFVALAPGAEAQTASQLRFVAGAVPATVGAGEPFSARVGVYDSAGTTLVTAGTHTVTLTLLAPQAPSACPSTFAGAMRPCGALLHGTGSGQQGSITATTSAGIATFTGLRVDAIGQGYRLEAASGTLTSGASGRFDVTTGQLWPEPQRTSARNAVQASPARMASPTALTDLGATPNRPARASPIVIDLDRDGLLDVVYALGFENTAGGAPTVVALRQSSPGTFSAYWSYSGFPTLQQAKDGNAVVTAGNVTGDPAPEVLVYWAGYTDGGGAAYTSGNDLRVLDGQSGTVLATWTPPGRWIQPAAPALGDVTGDGVVDIVVLYNAASGTFARAVQGVAVLNLAGSTFTVVAQGNLPNISYHYCGPGVGVTCTVTGPLAYATAPPVLLEARSGHAGLEVAIGSNGAVTPPTYVNGRPPGYVFLCSPTTGAIGCSEQVKITTANSNTGTLQSAMVEGLAAADLNADGSPDIVVNARYVDGMPVTQQVQSLVIVATSTTPISLASVMADAYNWNMPPLGDVDGDGQPDIANVKWSPDSGNAPRQGDVRVRGLSSSNTLVDKGALQRLVPAGQSSTESRGGALVELDYATGQTRKLELVFGSEDRTVVAVTQSTSPAGPALHWGTPATTTAVPTSPAVAADLNGDCAPEVLVGMANGNLRRVTGTAATAPAVVPDLNAVILGPYTSPGSGVQAKLFWNAPAGDGGMPILAYRVLRATSATGPFVEVGTWRGSTAPTQDDPFTDATLPSTGDYYYDVRAVNCAGLGPQQPTPFWAQVRTPAPPGNVAAAPFGAPAYAVTGGPRVRLSWSAAGSNAAAPNGCGAVLGYNIYRASASPVPLVPANRLNPSPLTGTSYVDTTPANLPYVYAVASLNCVGETPVERAVDLRLPDAIVPVLSPSGTTLVVSFGAPANLHGCTDPLRPNGWVEGYRIHRGTAPGAATYVGTLFPAQQTSTPPAPWRWAPAPDPAYPGAFPTPAFYLDQGLVAGTRYYYQVSVVTCVGEGPFSAEVSAVAGGAPPPLVADLDPGSHVGKPTHAFAFTAAVRGGTPPYTCNWSAGPTGATLAAPGGNGCVGQAILTSGAAGTTYTVTLRVTDASAVQTTRTATVEVVAPLDARLSGPEWGAPQSVFTLVPSLTGGMAPYACTWSVLPATASFTPPATSPCTSPATLKDGVVGTKYVVRLHATDGVLPIETDVATHTVEVRPNFPPVAAFTVPAEGAPGQGVGFTDLSYDRDGTIVAWIWDFGDGTTSRVPSPVHAWQREGTYLVRLTVIDAFGSTGTTERAVAIGHGDTVPTPEPLFVQAGSDGNTAPVADAGPDLSVLEGAAVTLQGRSVDGYGYTWRQVAGPTVHLRDAATATPSFTAPALASDQPVALQFTLQVDAGGQTSAPDAVRVRVTSGNRAPRVVAEAPQVALPGTQVTLDASRSTDADGDALRFAWVQAEGPAVELAGADTATPTFTAPAAPGSLLRFDVEVTDGRTVSTDSVTLVLEAAVRDLSFTVLPDPASPRTFTFRSDETAGAVTWTFSDGSPAKEGPEATHTFPSAGQYDVRMTVEEGGTTSERTIPVVVTEPKARSAADAQGLPWPWIALAAVAALLVAAVAVVVVRARRSR